MNMSTVTLFPSLVTYLSKLNTLEVSVQRQEALSPLRNLLKERLAGEAPVEITFICTHNSRRSHFGQVWMQVLAAEAGFRHIKTYSGGTEATACNPRTIQALRAAGFEIAPSTETENPHYHIRFSEELPGIEAWSKVYADAANPQAGYIAIMTCDSANEACPVVFGASARIPILYEDPKKFDDTPQEAAAYAERCRQIATEMKWVLEGI